MDITTTNFMVEQFLIIFGAFFLNVGMIYMLILAARRLTKI